MGAIYRMPFLYTEDFQETLKLLKESGITIYAAHLDGAEYYDKVSYTSKCAIMIGNEANGISPEAVGMSDQYIKIPMEGSVESLNAAVAAAVLMYEVYRQKRLND
jgi:TrmH family RNA methyltransferase